MVGANRKATDCKDRKGTGTQLQLSCDCLGWTRAENEKSMAVRRFGFGRSALLGTSRYRLLNMQDMHVVRLCLSFSCFCAE